MAYSPPGKTRDRVYRFVRKRLLRGEPPTVREVQQAMGFRAVESARSHLNALVKEGRLTHLGAGRSRGYALPKAGGRTVAPPLMIPLLGQVQAGELQPALEMADEQVAIEQGRYPEDKLFALRVKGHSMKDAGILPGDVLIVHQQPIAESGEIVVALMGNEATVKQLVIQRGGPELRPANARFNSIFPDPDQLQILGKVVEVRRYLS